VKPGTASGIQIVFLTFALLLLAVPLSTYLADLHGGSAFERQFVGRFVPFLLGAIVLFTIPGLRRQVIEMLSRPIPRERRLEAALVGVAKVPIALGTFGALALLIWINEGGASLEQQMLANPSRDEELEKAFSPAGIAFFLVFGAFVGPVLEELVFRGFLYRAWERRWGWIVSTVLVSTLFGLYHAHFFAAFTGSIVLVCVLRRTGTLWGPIVAHCIYNGSLWYPLAGQLLAPPEGAAFGDLASWKLQLACLMYSVLALPFYLFLARRAYEPDPFAGGR
jgi:membrane protease YdiL (CAAX protease family)